MCLFIKFLLIASCHIREVLRLYSKFSNGFQMASNLYFEVFNVLFNVLLTINTISDSGPREFYDVNIKKNKLK